MDERIVRESDQRFPLRGKIRFIGVLMTKRITRKEYEHQTSTKRVQKENRLWPKLELTNITSAFVSKSKRFFFI